MPAAAGASGATFPSACEAITTTAAESECGAESATSTRQRAGAARATLRNPRDQTDLARRELEGEALEAALAGSACGSHAKLLEDLEPPRRA